MLDTNLLNTGGTDVYGTRKRTLNSLYDSGQFVFVVLYGRRRAGKTALISRFLEQKNAIYFMGIESNTKQNLENLTQSIFQTGPDSFPLSFITNVVKPPHS
ncbi:MAG TPA: ATP-binding protein [Candidatus Aphodousia faecalis]|nr:ATP-binding protein [Candidatus Aphodousia faecalis]